MTLTLKRGSTEGLMPRLNRVTLTSQRPVQHFQAMNNYQITLAHNIRQARCTLKKTQAEVADFLGVDRTALVKIEKGDRDVKAHELEQIALCLETSVESLLGEKISKPLHFDYNAIPFTC